MSNGKETYPSTRHQFKPDISCGGGCLAVEETLILCGLEGDFCGNISTKLPSKICACIGKVNTGVVKIDLLA